MGMPFFLSFGCVGFGFELGSVRYAQRDAGAHTPSEDRQACLSGAGRGYLHALREYPAKTHFDEFLSKPQAWHIIAAQRAVYIIKGGKPPLYLITL